MMKPTGLSRIVTIRALATPYNFINLKFVFCLMWLSARLSTVHSTGVCLACYKNRDIRTHSETVETSSQPISGKHPPKDLPEIEFSAWTPKPPGVFGPHYIVLHQTQSCPEQLQWLSEYGSVSRIVASPTDNHSVVSPDSSHSAVSKLEKSGDTSTSKAGTIYVGFEKLESACRTLIAGEKSGKRISFWSADSSLASLQSWWEPELRKLSDIPVAEFASLFERVCRAKGAPASFQSFEAMVRLCVTSGCPLFAAAITLTMPRFDLKPSPEMVLYFLAGFAKQNSEDRSPIP
eukprot:740352_1